MRTFIIRARHVNVDHSLLDNIGKKGHPEIIAHFIMNSFFISNNFRHDVEVYIVLESTSSLPITIKLSGKSLNTTGFHERALLTIITEALKYIKHLTKNESKFIGYGVEIFGMGFEKILDTLFDFQSIYLLHSKGLDIRNSKLDCNPIFVLTDHLPMPKNNLKSLKRKGVQLISLGKKTLFASQCVVLINDELDRRNI